MGFVGQIPISVEYSSLKKKKKTLKNAKTILSLQTVQTACLSGCILTLPKSHLKINRYLNLSILIFSINPIFLVLTC